MAIYTYILQSSNRLYSGSNICSSHRECYQRGSLHTKGGNRNYCITGKVDLTAWHQFQSGTVHQVIPLCPSKMYLFKIWHITEKNYRKESYNESERK